MKKFMLFIISLILFIPSVKADSIEVRYLKINGNTNIYVGEENGIAVEYEITCDSDPSSSNNFNVVSFGYSITKNPSILEVTEHGKSASFPKGTSKQIYILDIVGLKAGESKICVTQATCFEVTVKDKPTTTTTTKKTTTTSTGKTTPTTKKNSTTTSTTKVKTSSAGTTSKRNTTTTIKSNNSITTTSNITTAIVNQETTSPIIEEPTTEIISIDEAKNIPKLNNLIVKNHKIAFSPDVFEYSIYVKKDEKTIDVETNCDQNYKCANGVLSIENKNEIIIPVTDEFGTQTDYKIIIKREKSMNFIYIIIASSIVIVLTILSFIICKVKKKTEIEVITLDELR